MVDDSDNPVKEWLNSPIPEKLWHYTSIHGFCGITSSKKIFATDIRFLNDSSEFIHARSITEQVIDDAPEKDENGWPLQKNLRQIISLIFEQGALSPDSLEIYTASFSAAEDQLSQWRGYSRGSSGMSLGLDLRSLRPSPGVGTLVTFAPASMKIARRESFSLTLFISLLVIFPLCGNRRAMSQNWGRF